MNKKILLGLLLVVVILCTGCVSVATPPPMVESNVVNTTMLFVEGHAEIGNLTTGNNTGTALCFDSNNTICACGTCS